MRIQVLYFAGCPNHAPTVELARQVVADLGLNAEVEEVEVKDAVDAQRLRFLGSPSVHVNGADIDPTARSRTDFGFCCRMYDGAGVPPRGMILAACEAARGRGGDEGAGQVCGGDSGLEPVAAAQFGPPAKPVRRAGLWAAGGSVLSAALASACCWLPLLLIAFGVSVGGVSAAFAKLRPVLLGAAAVLLGGGFYLNYFRKETCAPGSACAGPTPKSKRFGRAMLWVAVAAVLGLAFLPDYVGLLLADTSSPAEPDKTVTVSLDIHGMTCQACAAHIQKELANLPGVRGAWVAYAEGRARVALDAGSARSYDLLIRAVEKAGYGARLGADEP